MQILMMSDISSLAQHSSECHLDSVIPGYVDCREVRHD